MPSMRSNKLPLQLTDGWNYLNNDDSKRPDSHSAAVVAEAWQSSIAGVRLW